MFSNNIAKGDIFTMRTRRAGIFGAPSPKTPKEQQDGGKVVTFSVGRIRQPVVLCTISPLNDPKTRKRYKICGFVFSSVPRWTPLGRCNT